MFIEFDYTETKSLMQSFITLVSGLIVFSVSFYEKILSGFENVRNPKRNFFYILAMFLLSLIAAGSSLVLILAAVACHIYGPTAIPVFSNCGVYELAVWSWAAGIFAGVIFVGGLGVMVFSVRPWQR